MFPTTGCLEVQILHCNVNDSRLPRFQVPTESVKQSALSSAQVYNNPFGVVEKGSAFWPKSRFGLSGQLKVLTLNASELQNTPCLFVCFQALVRGVKVNSPLILHLSPKGRGTLRSPERTKAYPTPGTRVPPRDTLGVRIPSGCSGAPWVSCGAGW